MRRSQVATPRAAAADAARGGLGRAAMVGRAGDPGQRCRASPSPSFAPSCSCSSSSCSSSSSSSSSRLATSTPSRLLVVAVGLIALAAHVPGVLSSSSLSTLSSEPARCSCRNGTTDLEGVDLGVLPTTEVPYEPLESTMPTLGGGHLMGWTRWLGAPFDRVHKRLKLRGVARLLRLPRREKRVAVVFVHDLNVAPPPALTYLQLACSARTMARFPVDSTDYLLLLPKARVTKSLTRKDKSVWTFEPFARQLAEGGVEVRAVPWPVHESELPPATSEALLKFPNCCGWGEYLKLAAWTLVDYDRVVLVDADTFFLRPLGDLLEMPADLVYSRGKSSPLNAGVLILRPSLAAFDRMVEELRSQPFTAGAIHPGPPARLGGWNGIGHGPQGGSAPVDGHFHGEEGPQGFLFYFFHHVWGGAMEAAPCRLVLIEHLCPEYFASENLLAGVPAVLHKCDVSKSSAGSKLCKYLAEVVAESKKQECGAKEVAVAPVRNALNIAPAGQ